MKEGRVAAFKEHRARYLARLTGALPDYAIRAKVKPVLDTPAG
jgi:hypothetical protein